jgi:MFS family permease
MATFSAILFASPCLGPLVGGWIVVKTSYRWMWIVDTIFSAVVTVIAYFCLVETCVPLSRPPSLSSAH